MLLIYSKVRVFIHVQGKEEIHIFGTIPLRMYKNKRMRQVNKHKNENLDWEKSSIGINTLSQYCSVSMPGLRWGDADPSSKKQVLAYLLHGFSEFKRLSRDITPNIVGFQDTVEGLCVFVKAQLAMLPQGAAADGCYEYIPLEREGSEFLAFDAARAYAREQNIGTQTEWHAWSKSTERPPEIPSHPERAYAEEGWEGWRDWLGTEFLAFDAARTYARKQKLRSQKEWNAWGKKKKRKRPPDIPSHPERTYAEEGWVSWPDWLGTDGKRGKDERVPAGVCKK